MSLSFRDDARIAAYTTWIKHDVAAGFKQNGNLHFAVHCNLRLKPTVPRPAVAAEWVMTFAQLVRAVLVYGVKLGAFVIDQTGGVNENVASPEDIARALQDQGFSAAFVVSLKATDVRPLDKIEWSPPAPDAAAGSVVSEDHAAASVPMQFLAMFFPTLFVNDAQFVKTLNDFVEAAVSADIDLRVVRYLGPQLAPQLDKAVPEVGASPGQLPVPSDAPIFDGKGVTVGVVDYGCDFAHPNFRRPGGGTRLLWIWDMNDASPGSHPPPLPAPGPLHVRWPGRGLYRADIDEALSSKKPRPNYVAPEDHPYHVLSYHPHDNYYTTKIEGGAHGTFVLDVASGNGRATQSEERYRAGVAPGADIAFVQVPKPQVIGGRRIFNPWAVVLGTAGIFLSSQTAGRPAVVNISLNGTEGPHDGQTPYEDVLKWLCLPPGRAIVVGAGNFYEKRYHARGLIQSGAPVELTWRFLAEDTNRSEIEIWYDVPTAGMASLKVILTTPWGEKIEVSPGDSKPIRRNGLQVGEIKNFDADPLLRQLARRQIYLWVEPHERRWNPPADEDWLVSIEMANIVDPNIEVDFNAWISRDDDAGTAFAEGSSISEQTLGTLACSEDAIVVGAYSFVAEHRVPCPFSSAGPTRDDRPVPDIAAPGRGVWAARSTGFRIRYPGSGSSWRNSAAFVMDGTSTATPFVTGTVALMLQKNGGLLSAEVKSILKASARPQVAIPLGASNWDHQLGAGLLSTAYAVANTP